MTTILGICIDCKAPAISKQTNICSWCQYKRSKRVERNQSFSTYQKFMQTAPNMPTSRYGVVAG